MIDAPPLLIRIASACQGVRKQKKKKTGHLIVQVKLNPQYNGKDQKLKVSLVWPYRCCRRKHSNPQQDWGPEYSVIGSVFSTLYSGDDSMHVYLSESVKPMHALIMQWKVFSRNSNYLF